MRLVFMGTPMFAVPSLKALVEAGHEVLGVFTQPDKPKNRGMKLLPTPVKEYALTHNIPVYQPDKLKDGQTLDTLRQLNPEMIVVAAYGRILPVEILELPPLGCVNVHSSLLPKYRGLGRLRYFMIYTLSDENFSLSSSVEPPEEVDPTQFYFAMSLLTWAYWVLFSMLGGLAGSLITFDITGIDFALTALFVVLFIEQVIKRENRAPGAIGLVCSVVGLAVFGADNMVIPAMVLTLIVLLAGRRKLCA